MAKLIPLTKARFAIVDDEDYERFGNFKWQFDGRYVRRSVRLKPGKQTSVFLHRVILNAQEGVEVDHRNRDTLDNRRENLRQCQHSQNQMNKTKRKDNTTGYIGVSKHRSKWAAIISVSGKNQWLGTFDTAEQAAKAYDEAASKFHGEFASYNFPIG